MLCFATALVAFPFLPNLLQHLLHVLPCDLHCSSLSGHEEKLENPLRQVPFPLIPGLSISHVADVKAMFWAWAAVLQVSLAVELGTGEAWMSVGSAGNVERHRRGKPRTFGSEDSETKMMRRTARASRQDRRESERDEAMPDHDKVEVFNEVPLSQLRELGVEWRNSLMSNSSGAGDFRWGSAIPIIQGTAGAAGPKGKAGPKGPKGEAGPAGAKGDAGDAGEKGPPGEQGPMQDSKPPPEGIASVSVIGGVIVFNLISAGFVYAIVSGKLNKGPAEGKSMEEAPEEMMEEEAYPEEEEQPEEAQT
ncbi:unnamed protein product [Effrenium voratum]|nr:unnamed protein product [Effrenium voratum]